MIAKMVAPNYLRKHFRAFLSNLCIAWPGKALPAVSRDIFMGRLGRGLVWEGTSTARLPRWVAGWALIVEDTCYSKTGDTLPMSYVCI